MYDTGKYGQDKRERLREAKEETRSTKEIETTNQYELKYITFTGNKIDLNLLYTKMNEKMEMKKMDKIN